MKPVGEWRDALQSVSIPPDLAVNDTPSGDPTLRKGDRYFHSRYRPREEAERLAASAGLPDGAAVLVIGLGLGYLPAIFAERGHAVAVVEPDPAVARLALDGPLQMSNVRLAIGDAATIAADPAFTAFAREMPQVVVHPPTAQAYPEFLDAIQRAASRAAFANARLNIAVVGPIYGGSLPIAGYLSRAFERLGHRTLYVDTSLAAGLFDAVKDMRAVAAGERLSGRLVELLGEWAYMRVNEFGADICIALAQAPVPTAFARRLAEHGVVTAYWYVENWRHFGYWKDVAPPYDYFFHIQPGVFEAMLRDAGCKHAMYLPTACDPDIHRPATLDAHDAAEYQCEIAFAGAGYRNRQEILKSLTDFDLKIWGVEWHSRDLRRFLQRPNARFDAAQFAKIVAGAKINLNLHASQQHAGVDPDADAVNPRVFEIAACGGFQLCDACRGLDALFDTSTEIPVYHDLKELRAQIRHYLDDADLRAACAARARARALAEHTYVHRAQQMLEALVAAHGSRVLNKGVKMQRTVAEVCDIIPSDHALADWLHGVDANTPFTYDALTEAAASGTPANYPEQLFAYLRQVRETGESALTK